MEEAGGCGYPLLLFINLYERQKMLKNI